ncbi:SDR family oxidoreductase [Hyphomicrobium sp. LHD-15]|uniref:SDR family oxidoreductase n=1 Tax=Hyphomicrobium sp. LHD-15 TaxID=3072142 RepID=UPI00280F84B4|nr:SDR family oxidoreductase [Hyphomicrobium sp. LHD-15]MDQ8698550.1 SDR family oxidoreductase [Hyphomicrobium sp. LHD-15]
MSNETQDAGLLLVTGASGQLGRRVLAHLLDTVRVAPSRIVAVTRTPAKLADLTARGVDVRQGDFDDPASLGAAFKGVQRLLLISTDTLDRPGARLAQHRAAIAAAKSAGVRHVVYTSIPKADEIPVPFAPDHAGTEEALAASGLGWTILRNALYFDNLAFSLPSVLATGKWFTSAGDGRIANVSREDCARAAAYALAAASNANATYDITGPAALTTAEIAATVSEGLGKPIELVQLSDADLTKGLVAAGLPEFLALAFVSFDTTTRLGLFAGVSDAVEKLTGQKPETLQQFLVANKDSLLSAALAGAH